MSANKQMEDAVFYAAASIADAEQRRCFLDQSCTENARLREAVEKMLAGQEASDSFFKKGSEALALPVEDIHPPPASEAGPPPKSAADEYVGTLVGRYKLLQRQSRKMAMGTDTVRICLLPCSVIVSSPAACRSQAAAVVRTIKRCFIEDEQYDSEQLGFRTFNKSCQAWAAGRLVCRSCLLDFSPPAICRGCVKFGNPHPTVG